MGEMSRFLQNKTPPRSAEFLCIIQDLREVRSNSGPDPGMGCRGTFSPNTIDIRERTTNFSTAGFLRMKAIRHRSIGCHRIEYRPHP